MHALLHSVPPTLQQVTASECLCQRFLDTHGQVWISLLWGYHSFLLGPGVYKILFVPSQRLSMPPRQHIKKHTITLPTKVHLVKSMVFPMVMYGWESWTIKKAESRRVEAFELWCWKRLLRVPRTARRSNQSILKKINPECSLEGLMLNLKLQYFGHLMRELTN